MQISPAKFTGFLTGVLSVALIGGFGYFTYLVFFTGPIPEAIPQLTSVNPASYGPKIQKAAGAVKDKKILLGETNLAFTKTALFNSFTEKPSYVPLSDTRGREDPFVPYVAP